MKYIFIILCASMVSCAPKKQEVDLMGGKLYLEIEGEFYEVTGLYSGEEFINNKEIE